MLYGPQKLPSCWSWCVSGTIGTLRCRISCGNAGTRISIRSNLRTLPCLTHPSGWFGRFGCPSGLPGLSHRYGAIRDALRERHRPKTYSTSWNNPSVPIGKGHSVLQRRFRLFIRSGTYGTMRAMAHPRKSHEHDSTNGAVPGGRSDKDASEKEILIAGAIPITVAILITGFLHRARLHIMLRIVMAAALRLLRKIIYDAAQFRSEVKNKADDGREKSALCLRLQPELDQPADGLGAAGLVILSSGPSIDGGNRAFRPSCSDLHALTSSRPATSFFGTIFSC